MSVAQLAALLGSLSAAPALAADAPPAFDPSEISAFQREICELTARCRESWPEVELLSTAQARKALVGEFVAFVRKPDDPEPSAEMLTKIDQLIGERLTPPPLGIYLRQSDRILIFSDSVQHHADALGLDSARTRALGDCVLAHELTHALQAKVVERKTAPDAAALQRILVEAHASHVARKVCGRHHPDQDVEALLSLVDQTELHGFDLGSSSADPGSLGYGHGSRWLAEVLGKKGEAKAWTLLEDPPFSLQQFLQQLRDDVPSVWHDPDALLGFIDGEIDRWQPDPLWMRNAGRQDVAHALWDVSASLDPTPADMFDWSWAKRPESAPLAPAAVVGFTRSGVLEGSRAYTLSAFHFADEERAAAAMDVRRAGIRLQGAGARRAGGPFRSRPPLPSLHRAADDVIVTSFGTDEAFVETWAREGRTVVTLLLVKLPVPDREAQQWVVRTLAAARETE